MTYQIRMYLEWQESENNLFIKKLFKIDPIDNNIFKFNIVLMRSSSVKDDNNVLSIIKPMI